MGFWKRLFSAPDAVTEVTKSAISGLDSLVYTDQERADRTHKAQELYSQLWLAAVPSALSRRLIAVCFVFTYCGLIIVGTVLGIFGAWYETSFKAAEFVFRILSEVLMQPVNIIVGFYFLKQVVESYRKNNAPAD